MSARDSSVTSLRDVTGDSPPTRPNGPRLGRTARRGLLRHVVNRTVKTPACPLAPRCAGPQAIPMNVDMLTAQLRELVLERQALRERGAAADELERNRLAIVRAHWQLSYAFVELHQPHELDRAA